MDMAPRSIAVVLGTRPEIIKLATLIRLLGDAAAVVHTGQHFEFGLSATFLASFRISEPATFLGVGGRPRGSQIGVAVSALEEYLAELRPKALVVQGDTNGTLAGAIAANAREIPLVHVEAGLRSFDRRMPEEHNRVVTDHLSDLLCAPTRVSEGNLLAEAISPERIRVTGNTVIEAVHQLMPDPEERRAIAADYEVDPGGFVLSTFHRPENVDDPEQFAVVIKQLAEISLPVVLPLHPRSRARAAEFGLSDQLGALRVIDPIGYREFLGLGAESAFLVSDSGGVQEESSVYKKPVIVVRRSTERPEVLGSFARLVEPQGILDAVDGWLGDLDAVHHELANVATPYGDGTASDQIHAEIARLVAA